MPKIEEKSPVLQEVGEQKEVPDIIYKQEEKNYIDGMQIRLQNARLQRDTNHIEYDNQTYLQQHERNILDSISAIRSKKNEGESDFQSGMIRKKIFIFLAQIANLNLSADISAYREDQTKVQRLGDAMEDIMLKSDENQAQAGDDEGKMSRQQELLVQGTVFVEEMWEQEWGWKKELSRPFDGQISGLTWTNNRFKIFEGPRRHIITGTSMYLGNITLYPIERQPFIFTVENRDWSELEAEFGHWERWKFVKKTPKLDIDPQRTTSIFDNTWILGELQKGLGQIIRYQARKDNEFQMLINGVLMLPVGFPLSAISPSGEYTITQQNNEMFHPKFAYGKSMTSVLSKNVAVLDEMLKLGVLKTQKSFMPPRINATGRTLSQRIFMPGQLTRGIQPNQVRVIDENDAEGVTASEFGFMKEIKDTIDAQTASQTFGGGTEAGKVTATQILESQRQAKIILGITIFAMSTLEKKLAMLRLPNLFANWFDPEDEVVNDARTGLIERFRTISVSRTIESEGVGRRIVEVNPNVPSPEEIFEQEETLSRAEGVPVRRIVINPEEIKQMKLVWVVNVTPREKKTSELSKVLFGAQVREAFSLFPNQVNPQFFAEKFAEVWEIPVDKAFRRNVENALQEGAGPEGNTTTIPKGLGANAGIKELTEA